MTGMPAPVMEPMPPDCPRDHGGLPIYGGRLFYNTETGLAGCCHCGWSGVPTITGARTRVTSIHGPRFTFPEAARVGGIISTRCPSCESPELDRVLRRELRSEFVHERRRAVVARRVPRNEPCPCGSGLKAKKCRCTEYTT